MPATSLTHETDVAPPRWRLAGRVRPSWRRLAEVAGATAAALLLLLAPLMLGREALRHHQAERQAQMVQALGLALEAASGDLPARLHTLQVLPAASGGWAGEIAIVDGSRRPLAHWRQSRLPVLAPELFVDLLSLPATTAQAQLRVDGVPLALQARAGMADLLDLAWQMTIGVWAAVLGMAGLGVAGARRRERQLMQDHARHTQALMLSQQRLFDAQAEQLEGLRQRAHRDELTGLPNRRHFVALLDEWLAHAGAQGGLILLRLTDLQGVNQRVGRAMADRLLQSLAQTLDAYPQRIERCAAGRLNGADFALLLPAPGLARETAESLRAALRLALVPLDAMARVAIGAVELGDEPVRLNAQRVLALADAALAEAEVSGMLAVHHAGSAAFQGETVGEGGWQRRITRALAQGRVLLGEFPVCTADGRRLLLDCPLRVQLHSGGPYEPAQRWLALAVRSRLSAQVDEKALVLALAAIAADGQARCVNMSSQSLASPEFVSSVTRRLEASGEAASRLWIDIPESLALERPMLVRELSRQWHPFGAMLALEHAGEGLLRVPRLTDLGLDCVRIDGRFVNGIAGADAEPARSYLAGLVRLVQSVGLQVTAEGVRDLADLDVLWSLGFDAATGPALAGPLPPVADPGLRRPALVPPSRRGRTPARSEAIAEAKAEVVDPAETPDVEMA